MQNSPQDLRRKILGRKGEDAACQYLKKHGYKILKRNYKTPFGEADIIAKKDDTYCFVEVKARATDAFGLPTEAVDREKQRRYRMMAKYFCSVLREEVPIRFDVASIYEGEIEYFEGAFI
ncbi:MAG: YraN family protein [Clostridia bacterium]|nr:YraN family protein [Clostridia bacterium]